MFDLPPAGAFSGLSSLVDPRHRLDPRSPAAAPIGQLVDGVPMIVPTTAGPYGSMLASRPLLRGHEGTLVLAHRILDPRAAPAPAIFWQTAPGQPGRLQITANAAFTKMGSMAWRASSVNVFLEGASGGRGFNGQLSPAHYSDDCTHIIALVYRAGNRAELWIDGDLVDTASTGTKVHETKTALLQGLGHALGRVAVLDKALDQEALATVCRWVGAPHELDAAPPGFMASSGMKSALSITAEYAACALVPKGGSSPGILHCVPFGRNLSSRVIPASLTKILTAITAISTGAPLDMAVRVAPADATRGSGNNLQAGDSITLGDAISNMMLPSSNVAASAVARNIGERLIAMESGNGSGRTRFIQEMNDVSRKLGLHDSAWVNPHGNHAAGHYSSVRDLLKLGIAAAAYPQIMGRWGAAVHALHIDGSHPRSIEIESTVAAVANRDVDILGGKTGTFLSTATGNWYNLLIASRTSRGETLITVVAKASSPQSRHSDAERIIRWVGQHLDILTGDASPGNNG